MPLFTGSSHTSLYSDWMSLAMTIIKTWLDRRMRCRCTCSCSLSSMRTHCKSRCGKTGSRSTTPVTSTTQSSAECRRTCQQLATFWPRSRRKPRERSRRLQTCRGRCRSRGVFWRLRVVSQTQEGAGNEDARKRGTVPQPFKLSESKPKKQKEEEAPPEPFKPQPVPDTIYTTTLKEIEKEKEELRKQVKEETKKKYSKGPGAFKFKTDERPMNKEKLIEEAEEAQKKLLQFNKSYHEPPLTFNEIEAEVKLNAAAILREDYLLQKRNAEEEKRLKSYEVDLHNSGEFDQWQKEMKERDAIQQVEQMQKRKLEMQMAREEAIASCKKKLKENQMLVQKMKVESEIGAKERQAKIQEEMNRKQELRDVILEGKDNAAVEKEKILLKNQQIREEVEREIEEALKRKKEEELIEQQRRNEMIKKIRELESKPIERKTEYDPTETGGIGLLEEMSLAELRIRLESLKKQRIEEEERNRQENMKKKEEYAKMLLEKSERIAAARDRKARENDRLRQERKEREERKMRQEQEARERGLCVVQGKIAEKKSCLLYTSDAADE
eukprot:TRINITY_DN6756_c0_g1_i14.p1 TRINITY_DN6756_c0_g1~~TRINITY_DN6756_c0_g1_i14.p1  ORF type:complete len:555 (+),score=156.75 TRINITY_DN6756_c0_g1_i14:399-2063(+)